MKKYTIFYPELKCSAEYKKIVGAATKTLDNHQSFGPSFWRLSRENNLLLAVSEYQKYLSTDDRGKTLTNELVYLNELQNNTNYAVRKIIPLFEERGLPLMTIKSFLPFPYVDSNLDLLTGKPDKLKDYIRLLIKSGYRRYWNLADIREPMKQMYFKQDIKLRLHLHSAISWNGIVCLSFEQVWNRRRLWKTSGGNVYIPSIEDELLIMAAHALFENKYVSLHELLYWKKLVEGDVDWKYIFNISESYGWQHGMIFFTSTMIQLVKLLGMRTNLDHSFPQVSLSASVLFPYVIPARQNWNVTGRKLAADLRRGMWRSIPRSLFTFVLVDHLWMYRKAYHKKRKVLNICS
jgi:hypothetical protein